MKTFSLFQYPFLALWCALTCIVAVPAQDISHSVGTLQPGESITFSYEVTINQPLQGVSQISSQGTVSGSNFADVLTDDPETAAANDPTITILPNDLPLVGADAIIRLPGSSVKVSVSQLLSNDSDPEGGILTLTLPSAASANGATIAREGGWVIYSAPVNDNADSFNYSANDPNGGSTVGTVTVTVQADNSQSRNIVEIVMDGADRVIRFVGIPGTTYTIQFTLDLNSGSWTPLDSVPAGANGRFEFRDVNPPPPQRFYRTTTP